MGLKELMEKRCKSVSLKSKMALTIEIALLHEEENNFKEALDEYKELLSIALEENDVIMQAKAYRQMGECMLEMQRPLTALEHIKMYLKAAKSCGDMFEIQRACVTIGRCYLDIAFNANSPKEKDNFLNQSESAFLKSLQLTQKLSQAPCSAVSAPTDSKLESELAEMRSVSLFNLGLVNREKSADKGVVTAEKYFSQCSSLCLNRKLYDMYLRASMEQIDLKYNKALMLYSLIPVDQQKVKIMLEETVTFIKSSLKQLTNVPFTSTMKKVRRDIHALEARVLLAVGQILKAAKKYRNLRVRCQSNRENFGEKMKLCLRLHHKLGSLRSANISTKDNIFLGQLYEELGIHQLACKYYKHAMDTIKDKGSIDMKKLINKLITINITCGYHKHNLPVLEQKFRYLLREQSKKNCDLNDRLSSRLSCAIILRMIDAWIKSGTIHDYRDKVVAFVAQMAHLATIAKSDSIQIKTTRATIAVYEQLSTDNNGEFKDEIETAKEKLSRLKLTVDGNDSDNEIDDDDEFNCLSSSDEYNEPELSRIEVSESEYDEQLSTDSDFDHNALTECQIEELEAVGKRVTSSKKGSFIKRNDKGETMLHVAAIKGSVKQTLHLITQMKHPIDICDTAGWTPLHDAANHGHTRVVEVLLDHGANMEHTGSPVDKSTPLMEAVNGGNIDTAVLLLERGADLWHRNASGENIGDCIDSWRQRCRDNDAYMEPEAWAYKTLTSLIRNKLGSRYIEWCKQRKGTASVVAVTHADTKKNYTKTSDHRRTVDMEDSEEEGVKDRVSDDENDPVMKYCSVMHSLGSKTIKKKKDKDYEKNEVKENAGYVVGDDWLEDDMPKHGRTPQITEPVYGTFVRTNSRKRHSVLEEENENITTSKPTNQKSRKLVVKQHQLEHVPTSQLEDLFDPDNCVTSTQKTQLRSQPSTVTVTYRKMPMVIPLLENCSVQWLLDEIVRRYTVLVPNDPIKKCDVIIRISREDGALLMPSDPLLAAISDMSTGPIKLLATDITNVVITSDLLLDTQSLVPDQYLTLYSSIKSSLQLGNLDLNRKHLGSHLLEFLASLYYTQNLPALRRIFLGGNQITDELLNTSFVNSHGSMNLAQFIGNQSTTLEELDLSDNEFSGVALSDFLHTVRSHGLANLRILNLSNNPIGSNDYSVMTLIMKPILMSCPSVEQLRLSGCAISNMSELTATRNHNHDQALIPTSLRYLDISNNPCLLKRDCLDLMFWKYVKSTLGHLCLRGCGQLLVNYKCLSIANSANSPLVDMIASVVDLINSPQSQIHTLDIGNCRLDSESICHLNRLFTNKNCSLKSLICDCNDSLSQSVSCWSGLVHNLSQPLCTVSSLVIDMPRVTNYEDFLTVVDSIQRKITMRIGRPLSCLDLLFPQDSIDLIKDAVLDHSNKRVSDAEVQMVFDGYDLEEQSSSLSVFFVLSILDLMRDRHRDEHVKVLFDGSTVKFKCPGL